ncbi:MAG TPA: TPM domain-containing protein [Candidatus Udaeobacter sp.]|jgi:uncharacterized protein|nr:TPM domain-containing protein [Candidatus Udaeobacter sp.]
MVKLLRSVQSSVTPRVLLILSMLMSAATLARAEDIKKIKPTGYVMDLAGVIEPATKTRLEDLCGEVERKSGAQMAIVTVRSLEGESVQQYANDLFKHLGVGGKKDDRGVLLLVAPQERKYWTEVGYGLEPVINDARAGDAGRLMVPLLRQGNYSAAIEAAAWRLARYIADASGVTLTGEPPRRSAREDRSGGVSQFFLVIIGLVIFFAVVGKLFLGSNRSGRGGGSGGGGLLWFLLGVLAGSSSGSSGGGRTGGDWGGGGFGGGAGGWSGGGGFGGFGGGSSGGGGAGGDW